MSTNFRAQRANTPDLWERTTLWTNSSPSSAFSAQTVSLSQAFTNFDLIQIVYGRHKETASTDKDTKSNGDYLYSIYVTPAHLQDSIKTVSSGRYSATSISIRTSNYVYARAVSYNSSDGTSKLYIGTGNVVSSAAVNSNTNVVIPCYIFGIHL